MIPNRQNHVQGTSLPTEDGGLKSVEEKMALLQYHLAHPRSVAVHAPCSQAIRMLGPKVEGPSKGASSCLLPTPISRSGWKH